MSSDRTRSGVDSSPSSIETALVRYEAGDYEGALKLFERLEPSAESIPELRPFVETCRRVVDTSIDADDARYLLATRLSRWFRWLYAASAIVGFRGLASLARNPYLGDGIVSGLIDTVVAVAIG